MFRCLTNKSDKVSCFVSSLQKDPDRAVVVAITSREVFEEGADEDHLSLREDMTTSLLQVRIKN